MNNQTKNHPSCPNKKCEFFGKHDSRHIRRHSFYKTKCGRRRRYRCTLCGVTFCSTVGTPYHRLKKSREDFDEVAAMSVEGISKASIARIKGFSWNTVARWQDLAGRYARQFNQNMTAGFELTELQADEICTFVHSKTDQVWLFTTLEVWSRLWIRFIAGKRSYHNVKKLLLDTIQRACIKKHFLFTTDGFEPYGRAVKRLLAPVCIYGQIIKERHNNRVTSVERRLLIGSEQQLRDALVNSEDSDTLNTSFIERHNLTIRRGSAYLNRRSICYARYSEYLESQLDLLQCYYNFIRPHGALRFGKQIRTPAMQAGLVAKRLSFRDVFTYREIFFLFITIRVKLRCLFDRSHTIYRQPATVS